jgi:hypothetical protein
VKLTVPTNRCAVESARRQAPPPPPRCTASLSCFVYSMHPFIMQEGHASVCAVCPQHTGCNGFDNESITSANFAAQSSSSTQHRDQAMICASNPHILLLSSQLCPPLPINTLSANKRRNLPLPASSPSRPRLPRPPRT